MKHAGWTIREKQQSHFIYIYDDATFTSLSDAARYHIDHVGTTDQDFYFKIGEEDEEEKEEESSALACRFQCGFRVHETNKRVLEAHEMFCRVARVRSAAERSFEAHKIWLSNSNERTEGHVVSLSRKGVRGVRARSARI